MDDSESADVRTAPVTSRAWSTENWALILLFSLLTLVGVVISTGELNLGIIDASKSPTATDSVRVPMYVYLYASLGALGYIFTKLMTNLERFDEWGEIEQLAEMGLRLPAAWVLAGGTFLLLTSFSDSGDVVNARFVAGLAFLVGLYVNVALKSLGGLADRLLGRGA